MKHLILASSSPYRRQLLARLRLEFETQAPAVDETAQPDESPLALASRLASQKARSIATPQAVVIGSDQVAELDGKLLRKPGSHQAALQQLLACQGHTVNFHTAVTVIDTDTDQCWQTADLTEVQFAKLDETALDAYLHKEQPYDCAGGFKAEGLGIALFTRIKSDDPSALLGLPLIWLAQTIRHAGFDPLG